MICEKQRRYWYGDWKKFKEWQYQSILEALFEEGTTCFGMNDKTKPISTPPVFHFKLNAFVSPRTKEES